MRLSEAIDRYLRSKRGSGLAYETEAWILSAFRRYVNDLLIAEVTPKHVIDFLNVRRCSNRRWMIKHGCLRIFFEFWTDRGHMSALSMPQPRKAERDRLSAPYIYTRSDLRKLIQGTHASQASSLCVVSEATFRTLLLTLYGTGAMTGEIFWLRRDDLDLKRNLVLLRGNRKILPRRVPINKDLHEELSNYIHSRERKNAGSNPLVFVSNRGEPLQAWSIAKGFARLRTRAGVVRVAAMHRPRLCDLRQTFAVHRIASWIEEGADLNRMLPALSAYMGLSGFESMQRLLGMTPERFKSELDELSPYRRTKHWRDDSALMSFLASLPAQTRGSYSSQGETD